jgi:hypothetical protein
MERNSNKQGIPMDRRVFTEGPSHYNPHDESNPSSLEELDPHEL